MNKGGRFMNVSEAHAKSAMTRVCSEAPFPGCSLGIFGITISKSACTFACIYSHVVDTKLPGPEKPVTICIWPPSATNGIQLLTLA